MKKSGDKSRALQKMSQSFFSKTLPSLLIYGPPGSGKGTMGRLLSFIGGVFHLSSGDIFRSLSPDSPGGQLYQQYATKGLLLPDEVTVEIWHSYVSDLIGKHRYRPDQQYLLLDGIPRTVKQVELLETYVEVRHILVLEVKDTQKLFERLLKRAKIEGRQDDVNIEILETRMKVYEEETSQVLNCYPQKNILHINANQLPFEVLREILTKAGDILKAAPSAEKPSLPPL